MIDDFCESCQHTCRGRTQGCTLVCFASLSNLVLALKDVWKKLMWEKSILVGTWKWHILLLLKRRMNSSYEELFRNSTQVYIVLRNLHKWRHLLFPLLLWMDLISYCELEYNTLPWYSAFNAIPISFSSHSGQRLPLVGEYLWDGFRNHPYKEDMHCIGPTQLISPISSPRFFAGIVYRYSGSFFRPSGTDWISQNSKEVRAVNKIFNGTMYRLAWLHFPC